MAFNPLPPVRPSQRFGGEGRPRLPPSCQATFTQTPVEDIESILTEERLALENHEWNTTVASLKLHVLIVQPDSIDFFWI